MPAHGHTIYVQKGGFSWKGVWNGIKKAYDWIKKNKVISKGASLIGHPEIGAVAGQLGYRQRKRRTKVQMAGAKRKGTKTAKIIW
jgi:hypothetical protein